MIDDYISDKEKSGPKFIANRLLYEKSPYLLQHAYNLVHWYPWGEEAFDAARKEDKPIFLSVGYSTCHWCHVMAHESFEDPAVAALMNQAFVCIKVDREERPDIDQLYMTVAQAVTGRGGWPLTIIMTAERKPFFAATYVPKTGRFGQVGMMELIPKIKEVWDNNRNELLDSADNIVNFLKQSQRQQSAQNVQLNESILADGYNGLISLYDAKNGGFGGAPKFPAPHNLLFLLRHWQRTEDDHSLQMVEATLQAMRMGGIYDHIGFGFHRYSTDAQWFIPHFEKMLYDQALMAMAYTEAYQVTGKEEYASVAREILGYVLRDMTSFEGGFYSAEDADSEGVEGKFYSWTAEELKAILDDGEFKLMIRLFDVYESGNFEMGRNILRQRSTPEDAASVLKITEKDMRFRLEGIRSKIFVAREKRIRPSKDDKILVDWNGLMIAALAKASQALGEPDYAVAAKKASDFIMDKMLTPKGRLLHRFRGEAGLQANLDDYSFLIFGLINLYETIFEVKYLKTAIELCQVTIQHFWDKENGGFFLTPDDGEALLVRQKEFHDGAVPSGNSLAMYNLLRLSHLTGDSGLEKTAWNLAQAFAGMKRHLTSHTMMLCSLDYALGPSSEIVLVGSLDDAGMIEFLRSIRSRFLPNNAIIFVSGKEIREIAPYTRDMVQLERKATAYVCTGHACHLPVTIPEKMMSLLECIRRKS